MGLKSTPMVLSGDLVLLRYSSPPPLPLPTSTKTLFLRLEKVLSPDPTNSYIYNGNLSYSSDPNNSIVFPNSSSNEAYP